MVLSIYSQFQPVSVLGFKTTFGETDDEESLY